MKLGSVQCVCVRHTKCVQWHAAELGIVEVQHCEPAGEQSFRQSQCRVVHHGYVTHIQSGQTHTLKQTHTHVVQEWSENRHKTMSSDQEGEIERGSFIVCSQTLRTCQKSGEWTRWRTSWYSVTRTPATVYTWCDLVKVREWLYLQEAGIVTILLHFSDMFNQNILH